MPKFLDGTRICRALGGGIQLPPTRRQGAKDASAGAACSMGVGAAESARPGIGAGVSEAAGACSVEQNAWRATSADARTLP